MSTDSNRVVSPEALVQQLRWRYAVKKFDPTRKIPAEEWAALEQSLVLTPSSFGLQPWKFVVITNQEVKNSLVPHAWGQRQIAECSHLLVFATIQNIGPDYIDRYIQTTAELRGVAPEALDGFRSMMVSFISKMSPQQVNDWSVRQIYIALGNFMTSAAVLGIDTCPMEGFEQAKFNELLGLPDRGLSATVAAVAGYRAVDDKYAALPKVRFAAEDLIERIS